MFQSARVAGVTQIHQVNHGNALSFYFSDPQGNGIEITWTRRGTFPNGMTRQLI